MSELLQPDVLLEMQARGETPTLIHLLPEDAFAEMHIPGSRNFCIYESAFLTKIGEAFPDKDTPMVVYGWSGETREAEVAAGRLEEAGYRHVSQLAGGLIVWRAVGGAVEGTGGQATPPLNGRFVLDREKSVIFWTGRNLFNHHHGSVKLAEGEVQLANDALKAASFVIDMESIACDDLTDLTMNAMLVRHLKSDDFFDVARFPAAKFVATSVEPISGCTVGTVTHSMRGPFTLRGVTQEISFPAQIVRGPEGAPVAQAEFSIDRTRWGAIYGSGKFFARLGQHVVNDAVHLYLKLYFAPVS